jgi:hypothetical protein
LFSRRRAQEHKDEANAKGWMVVDMKNDWRTIFPGGGGGR